MGTIIEGKCVKCGYQTKVMAGGGLRDCRLQTALDAVSDDMDLAATLERCEGFRIERVPSICVHCHKLLAPPWVIYWTRDGAEHTVPAVCPDCGGPVEQRKEGLPCPVCGEPLEMFKVGHWD